VVDNDRFVVVLLMLVVAVVLADWVEHKLS
jgi:hypothetical protein